MTHQTPDVDLYENYPLVQSLLYNEATRTASLKEEGKVQIDHAKSNEGWASTIFIIRGRALDWMVVPWSIAVLHATLYTLVQELVFHDYERDSGSLENVFRYARDTR